jgi:hypothetical protein
MVFFRFFFVLYTPETLLTGLSVLENQLLHIVRILEVRIGRIEGLVDLVVHLHLFHQRLPDDTRHDKPCGQDKSENDPKRPQNASPDGK